MCITNQILALCTIHPLSVDGVEKLVEDSGKKVPPAHAQRVYAITSHPYTEYLQQLQHVTTYCIW